ncbi:MAG: glycoside hydrolase family 127 protein [Anaerolineae bacterium]|nr:glycoside hydrolase family 127 protein [Anaerolineae bacterium]
MNPFKKITLKPQALSWLRFGAIKPGGWLRAQMERDLEQGFVGRLDELVPDLIRDDDIYGADRLTKEVDAKDLGLIARDTGWEIQYLWWNSETQSNWRDGMVRATLLLEHPDFLPKAQAYIEHILATQDDDGYLGIYAPDLRFNFTQENGELWAQSSLFRGLLGYYEATGDERVLKAVQRAVATTMRAYPIGQSTPFTVEEEFAGVTHGLTFTDTLDRLAQLTGAQAYLDYALWLYQEFSTHDLSQDDVQARHLLDPEYRFQAHGVHTYEHLRALLTAVYASSNPQLEAALEGYLDKLAPCIAPSGGPIGDEGVGGRSADANETGYEYCSIHEMLDSYTHLLQKTGAPVWGDRAEWLFFNAAQGSRHPYESAVAYLKTDNSFSMTGTLHPGDPIEENNPQTRYKYSPAHRDLAVCCPPNAGRVAPYYVKAMWLRDAHGLTAMLYGPSVIETDIKGVTVRISEETRYPFDLDLTFTLELSAPLAFDLAFRMPGWACSFTLDGVDAYHESNDLIHVHRTWQTGDRIHLRFQVETRITPFNGEALISHGPLLFALPLTSEVQAAQEYAPGFRDLYYAPADATGEALHIVENQPFALERAPFDPAHPWQSLALVGKLWDETAGTLRSVRLLPLGATILRRVTFKC